MDPLATITTAINTAKSLWDISQKLKDAELHGLVADLKMQLADLKDHLAALQNENTVLRAELARLKDNQAITSQLESRDGLYYWPNPPNGKSPGPYCTRCADVDNQSILLTKLSETFHSIGRFKCPQCKQVFT